jgi:hypothetical protein
VTLIQKKSQYSQEQVKALYGAKAKNKYGAKKTAIDGITFDSKKEANYYLMLKLEWRANQIRYFLRQVPFDLPGNTKYRVDFMVVGLDGAIRYVDVKGHQTKEFIRAKKQVEAVYGIEIELA